MDENAYEFQSGLFYRNKFSISENTISWKNKSYDLSRITRIRYGGIQTTTRLYGILPISRSTEYRIAFGDEKRMSSMYLTDRKKFEIVAKRLSNSVRPRLMYDIFLKLRRGEKLKFADAVVDDFGVEVTKRKFFRTDRVFLKWSEIRLWSKNGAFLIGSKIDKKCYSEISYIHIDNTHMLDACLHLAFRKGVGTHISDILLSLWSDSPKPPAPSAPAP